jgi:serine/threonine-protein kinase
VIGTHVSHYKILKKIGMGGMGVVYQAEDTQLRRTVALKFLAPELTRDERAKKRFLHEAQGASALDHPNVCSIHEIGETETGQMFICMAYYEGTIVDFGLAKLRGRSKVTASGSTLGTAAYMSPEQAVGDDIDGRTDIWSLGVVLHEALTSGLPFRGEVDNALLYSIINEDPTPLRDVRPDVPEELAALVHKCLEKNREDRFQTAEEMLTALRAMARKLGWHSTGSLRSVIRVGTAKRPSRVPLILTTASVVLLAAILFIVITRSPRDSSTKEAAYSTQVRSAIMPLRNLAGDPITAQFVHGLSERIAIMADLLSNSHGSMWVAPYSHFLPYHRLTSPEVTTAEAEDAFGVNRLLTGNVQRYGEAYRLSLELLEAASTNRLDAIEIDFELDDLGDMDARLIAAVSQIFRVEPDEETRRLMASGSTIAPLAFRSCMEGLGYLQRYETAGNPVRAGESFRSAIALDDNYVTARAGLGLSLFREFQASGEPELRDRALKECSLAVAMDTTNTYALTLLGGMLLDARSWDSAEAAIQRVSESNRGAIDPYELLAWLYRNTQRVDEAEDAYRMMIEIRPDYYWGHLALGSFLMRSGRTDEALEQYESVLSYAPNDAWTLNALGVFYLTLGEWGTARDYLQRSFAVRPNCETCMNIGIVYYYDGKFDEAAEYYEFSFAYCDSTERDFYIKWNSWGEALYWADGRRHEADDKYRQAVRLAEQQRQIRPRDPELLAYLAGLYAMLDERDKALAFAEDAASLVEEDGFVLLLLSYTYEKLADREKALHYIGRAIRNDYPVRQITVEPMLRDLVQDVRFQELVEAIEESAAQNPN